LPLKSAALSVPDALRALLVCGAAASLCACQLPSQVAGFRTAAVDPASPVYQDVMKATQNPGPYPTFAAIPKLPTDVRPVPAWATAVASLKADRATLESDVVDMPPAPTDTESFAATARSEVQAPAAETTPEQTAADAQSLKARATPPPKRRAHKR
jgi:hypothetical protein